MLQKKHFIVLSDKYGAVSWKALFEAEHSIDKRLCAAFWFMHMINEMTIIAQSTATDKHFSEPFSLHNVSIQRKRLTLCNLDLVTGLSSIKRVLLFGPPIEKTCLRDFRQN